MTDAKDHPIKDSFILEIRDFFSSKSFWQLSIGGMLVFSLYYIIFLSKSDLVIDPIHPKHKIHFFNDRTDLGKSKITHTDVTSSQVKMEFILLDGFAFPYAGMEIIQDSGYFDVSAYNKMEVNVSGENLQHVFVYLNVDDKNVKDKSNKLMLRRLGSGLELNSNQNVLALQELETPDWWYNVIHQPKSDFSAPDLNKVKGIMISTGLNPVIGRPGSLTLHSITFYQDNTLAIIKMILLQLSLVSILFLFHLQKRKHRIAIPQVIEIRYTAIQEHAPHKIDTAYSFLDFIHEHYIDPELGLKEVARAVGMNERTISDTISEKFGCNFKSYINQIRIAEAKRLLLSSDLRVSEIAYKVGFNSPVNFNRVFKTITGQNPSEFLNKNEANKGELV